MLDNYLSILEESLQKKVTVLDKIKELNTLLDEKLLKTEAEPEEIDLVMEQRSALTDELEKLDEGFEKIYDRIRETLRNNQPQYREQIGRLQALIEQVTDRAAGIQAQEMRLKNSMERYFASKKSGLADSRKSLRAVRGYIQQGQTIIGSESLYMDTKK